MGSGKAQEMCLHNRMRIAGRHHKANGRARGDAKHYRGSRRVGMDGHDNTKYSGGDARRGHTRSHPEHDG